MERGSRVCGKVASSSKFGKHKANDNTNNRDGGQDHAVRVDDSLAEQAFEGIARTVRGRHLDKRISHALRRQFQCIKYLSEG